ncbi:hypothetical protein BDY19DRAFT_916338 [Irpex rosettiformis]|uniref:Uncharacterized protein n=1 Tax=Irpex rosettiformis TaxID=378272 RepID=A0ACB8UL27_9APHY|nr:hypothetical protein BDY19DRAFT_916338 [Irpex rosettiformis]
MDFDWDSSANNRSLDSDLSRSSLQPVATSTETLRPDARKAQDSQNTYTSLPVWCPLALTGDRDGSPDCGDPFPSDPSPELLDLFQHPPCQNNYDEEYEYEMAMMVYESSVCKRISFEIKLQYWVEMGFPTSINYDVVARRVLGLRHYLITEVINMGRHVFMFRELASRVAEINLESPSSKLELNVLNKAARIEKWDERFKDLFAPGYFGLHGRQIVDQTLEIMFPNDAELWNDSDRISFAPLTVAAFRTFVVLPEALIRLVQEDRKVTDKLKALDFLDDTTEYGIHRFDEDKKLEDSFLELGTRNLQQIRASRNNPPRSKHGEESTVETENLKALPLAKQSIVPPRETRSPSTIYDNEAVRTEDPKAPPLAKPCSSTNKKRPAPTSSIEFLTTDSFQPPSPPKRARNNSRLKELNLKNSGISLRRSERKSCKT